MAEIAPDKPHGKTPIQVFRERRGGVPKKLVERNRKQIKTRKQITQALRDSPQTIPEIAAATGIPAHEVMWQVMAMKKYGTVVEGEERDSFFAYALTVGQENNK